MLRVLAFALSFVFLSFGAARAHEVLCPASFPVAGARHNHSEADGPTYCSLALQLLDHHCIHSTATIAAVGLELVGSGKRSYKEFSALSPHYEQTRFEHYSSRGPPFLA